MESVAHDKMWLTPQHHSQRMTMTAGSAEQDESTLSIETIGNSLNSKDLQVWVMYLNNEIAWDIVHYYYSILFAK